MTMKLSRVRSIPMLIAIIPLLTAIRGVAYDDEASRKSLRGLVGAYVIVEPLPDEEKRDGLNAQDIRTDVELKLRLAGVKVLTEEEWYAAPGHPFLYVNVNTKLHDGNLWVFSTEVSLEQDVLLERDQTRGLGVEPAQKISKPFTASTWSTGIIGTVGKDKLSQVRGIIKEPHRHIPQRLPVCESEAVKLGR
jgi:hypothetical protein